MLVNGLLGVVLWSTYSEVSTALEPHLATHPTFLAAISGACAGGMQAFVAAPAENVRFVLEGASSATGWSHAWKEVFRGTEPQAAVPREAQVREARQVREWMKEVGEMAGRGWDGWGWGFAKDVCGEYTESQSFVHIQTILLQGFAIFFAIFDVTRRVAAHTKAIAQDFAGRIDNPDGRTNDILRRHIPRVAHATTLVSGGVIAGLAYELSSRPWDIARKAVRIDQIDAIAGGTQHSFVYIVLQKLRTDGLFSFFENTSHVHQDKSMSPLRRSLLSLGRTIARVGPWGVGFLVWEAFGPGIS